MILEILWHSLACIKTSLDLSVCDVTSNDDSTCEVYTGRNRVFAQFLTDVSHWLIEVDVDCIALTCLTE